MHVHQSAFAGLVLHDMFENLVLLFIAVVVFVTKLRSFFQVSVLCCGTVPRSNGEIPNQMKHGHFLAMCSFKFMLSIVECPVNL